MFWSKYKKRIELLEEQMNKLNDRVNNLEVLIANTVENQDQINRIIKYSVPGKITHIHNVDLDLSNECIKRKTTI